MNLTGTSLLAHVRYAVARLRPNDMSSEVSLAEPPLRAEFLSADQLEQRGAEVRFSATGKRPVPPPSACRALVDAVAPALLAARHSARLTLSAAERGVQVGVVTDVVMIDGGVTEVTSASGEVSTVVVEAEEQTWVEARWTPSAS